MDLSVQVQKDVNGIEMGVLENGIPFLTQVGLAKISGISRSVVYTISQEWEKQYDDQTIGKDRNSFLKQYLFRNDFLERKLYIETIKDGSIHYAYPDIVYMAILEFYSFEAKTQSKVAVDNYRKLATHGLQTFIYDALGYALGDKWKFHNDRVSILKDSSPDGYFTVFNEI